LAQIKCPRPINKQIEMVEIIIWCQIKKERGRGVGKNDCLRQISMTAKFLLNSNIFGSIRAC
jgi:hypothetical protein